MKKLLPLWMFLPIFLVLAACSDNSEDIDRYYATVSTPKVTTTTPTSLTVTASVTGDLNQIVKKGFCYSAAASVPTIKDHVVDADENFSASLSTLTSGTSYYIRAYVYCDSRYVYSEVVTATTESLSLDDELKNYVAPTYSDDYTSISDWSKRSQWNLANVHDPSVVLAEDGYYYMYQTDASYGNVHTAGGHFHGRRSKDLVNWEYLGGTMKNLPEWVVPKLNEIRKEMGLAEINPNVNDFGYCLSINEKTMEPDYEIPEEKKKLVTELKTNAKKAKKLFIKYCEPTCIPTTPSMDIPRIYSIAGTISFFTVSGVSPHIQTSSPLARLTNMLFFSAAGRSYVPSTI